MDTFLEHLFNGLSLGAIYALVALGYSLAYGVLQMINFAHAEIYMMSSFFAWVLKKETRLFSFGYLGIILWIMATLIFGGVLAALIEKVAYQPLRNQPRVNVLITAIGVSLFLQYFSQLVFGAEPKFFQPPFPNQALFTVGEISLQLYDFLIMVVTALILIFLNHFVKRTWFGKAMRALSFNTVFGGAIGLPVNNIISRSFFLGGVLAASASILVPLKYPKIDPLMGLMMGLKAFVAAVLGGIGNLHGAVLGAFLLGLIEQLVAGYVTATFKDAVAFVILIMVLIFRPEGLLGVKRLEKV